MKTSFTLAVTAALLQAFTVCSHGADQLFDVNVHAITITTNPAGNLVYGQVHNEDIIQQCANEHNLTNLTGLMLVYNLTADAVEVVTGTNNTVVCTPLTFKGGVSLSNTNGTRTERLAQVFVESSTTPNGSLSATERTHFGASNEITSFRLTGRLQYAVPANGTNRPVIYNGIIVAGSDMEGHGPGEGNHGKHPGHGDDGD